MNFVLVGPAPPLRGGISQYNWSLAGELALHHRVVVISFSRQYPALLFPGASQREGPGEAAPPPAREGPVTVEALVDSIRPSTWKEAADRIRGLRPEAVVFQWWHPFFSPAFTSMTRRIKKNTRSRVLFLCHNVYPHERLAWPGGAALEEWLIGRAFAGIDGFLVHSERLGEQVRHFKPAARLRRVFHPSYDFYSAWDAPTPPSEGRARLLFFGNIRPYKGLEVLLEALGRIAGRLDFEATVAGEFYVDSKPYRDLAERLGVADRIVWIDRYVENERVPALFRAADLVVLPYLRATQSGVVPLAYQFERPVIASDVGGLSEVVLDGLTGYLVPPGDPAALARRILDFFGENRPPRFQDNIRAFRSRLSWRQVTDGILELLDSPPGKADSIGL